MNKLNDSMWRVVGLASLVVLGGALAVAGCSNDDPVADAGGNGGEGGAGTGGAGTGGATASCDAPGLGAGGGGGAAGEEIEIAGSYDDSYGGEVVITTTGIESIGVYQFSLVDNEGNFAIARNDEANTYNPCMWSRFDWTTDGGDLYYCQSAFDAADEQTAANVPAGDAENLETGCGGFEWSKLTSL